MARWVFLDAPAQSTAPGAITNVQTTIVLASSAAFGAPAAGDQIGLIILDSGNVSWNANNPLATPYEYVYETGNVPGTNTITVTRARAGTTAKAFSAGATIAAVLLAEAFATDGTGGFARTDLPNYTPNLGVGLVKIEEQILVAPAANIRIPASGSFPTGFRSLRIHYIARDASAGTGAADLHLQFNGDTAAHYYDVEMINNSATTLAYSENLATTDIRCGQVTQGGALANSFSIGHFEIPFFNSTFNAKTIYGQVFNPTNVTTNTMFTRTVGGLWGSTVAAQSLLLFVVGQNLGTNTAVLTYGIP